MHKRINLDLTLTGLFLKQKKHHKVIKTNTLQVKTY
jgi:hypothetical protein